MTGQKTPPARTPWHPGAAVWGLTATAITHAIAAGLLDWPLAYLIVHVTAAAVTWVCTELRRHDAIAWHDRVVAVQAVADEITAAEQALRHR